MGRVQTFLITVLVVLGTVSVSGVAAGSDEAYVAVTDVTVTPETPTPGATATVRVTIENGGDSPAPVTDMDVALRSARGFDGELEYARVRNVGDIPPGSSVEVPLAVTFEEPGVKQLRVRLWGRANNSYVRNRYPLTVRVADQHPGIDAELNDTVAGIPGEGRLVVSNGLDSPIQNVELTIEDSDGTIEISDSQSVLAELPAGETTAADFEYEADEPGTHEVLARVQYTGPGTQRRQVNETFTLDVKPLQGNVTLAATQDAGSTVSVEIINSRNVPIENVMIDGVAPNATVSSHLIKEIPAQSSRTVQLNTSLDSQRATLEMTASYKVGNTETTVSDEVVVRSVPGRIELTGVEIRPENGRLVISGSASNIGLEAANSVIVRVIDTDQVTPAAPAREYFVGTVPSSDFVSFEVSAQVNGQVSAIPLEVTYLVDDQKYTRVVRVPYESTDTTQTPAPEASGISLFPVVFGTVLVVGVGAIMYIGWRNSRQS